MTARAKAEELGASLCSRVFELPAKWSIFEINDEELIYDNLDNPYTLKLHEVSEDPAVFTVATVPVFDESGSSAGPCGIIPNPTAKRKAPRREFFAPRCFFSPYLGSIRFTASRYTSWWTR